MAKKCQICKQALKKNDKSIPECASCDKKAHKTCADEEQWIFRDGIYFCKDHARHIPTNYKRNQPNIDPVRCYSCSQTIRASADHFTCIRCSKKFHDNCMRGEYRNNLVLNNWYCPNCYNEHNQNINAERGSEKQGALSIPELVQALIETKLSNRRLSDKILELENAERQDLSSVFAFARPSSQHNNLQGHSTMPGLSTEINNEISPTTRNNLNSDPTNIQDYPPRLPNPNIHSQHGNLGARTNSRNHHQAGVRNEPRRIDTNITMQELEDLVNSSIARVSYNNLQQDFHALAEIQLSEAKKNTYRKLPVVEKTDYSWKIFYNAFLETKGYYTPFENVGRLQQAIKCNEIRKLGGVNLFNLDTYEATLFEINKRIGKPKNILIKERSELVKIQYLNDRDTSVLIEFIEKVKQYASLVEHIGTNSQKYDEDLIIHLSRILPPKLKTQWTDRFNDIEELRGEIQIKDLATFLDKKIKRYETDNMFNRIDPYKALDKKSTKEPKPNETYLKRKGSVDHRMFSQVNTEYSKKQSTSKHDKHSHDGKQPSKNNYEDSPAIYCWYHERRGHSSLICHTLKRKSGKEVCKLAREKNICTICGRKHDDLCKKKKEITCLIPGCNMNHEMIFCYKRKVIETKEKSGNKNTPAPDTNLTTNQSTSSEDSQMSEDTSLSFSHTMNNENSIIDALHTARENDGYSSEESSWVICDKEPTINSHSMLNTRENEIKTSPTLLSIVVIKIGDSELEGAFLIDSGSTISLIEEKWANKINLEGPLKPVKLSWSGGVERHDYQSRVVKTFATGIHKNAKKHEIYFHTMNNLRMPKQIFDAAYMRKKFPHLNDIELKSYSQVIGILGNDQCWLHKQLKWVEKENDKKAPVAVLTPLGYYVIGSSSPLPKIYNQLKMIDKKDSKQKTDQSHVTTCSEEEEKELREVENRLMGQEYKKPYENDRQIAEEETALKILRENVKKIEGQNRYEAPMLWNQDDIELPTVDSLKTSLRRNHIMIKQAVKLGRSDEIKSQIGNLIRKGYARLLPYNEVQLYPKNTFYIPIFTVLQPGKRIRLVWDAACKINGKSLNDWLFTGPNLYVDLLAMLFQMREGKFLIKGDISEMYHQIKIIEKDRPSLRFVFSDSPEGKVNFYEMSSMIFGAICSPTTSQFVKNLIADEFTNKFPEASNTIKQNMYVDDYVKSFNDLMQGKRIIKEVRDILKSGGMNLVKLKSNDMRTLELIKHNLSKEEEDPKLFSQETTEKVLGYVIDFLSDTISMASIEKKIDNEILRGNKIPTKREFLKFMMSFYDPIGLFTYFTSKLKLVYHWICKEKLDWHESMSTKQLPYWRKILTWYKNMSNIKIHRPYSMRIIEADDLELFIFGDAGKEILCCSAYIRFLKNKKQIDYKFIASKSFIVPLKQKRSIPELELDIAVKSTEFAKTIKRGHTLKFDRVFYLTDSACVYHWIQTGAHKPTLYVKNRLVKIYSNSKKKQWRWISTELQAADFGTKFESMPKLSENNEFYNPKLFLMPEDTWPSFKPPSQEICDQMNVHLSVKTREDEDDLLLNVKNFSNWNKAIRSVQTALKYSLHVKRKLIRKKLVNASMVRTKVLMRELFDCEKELKCEDFKRRQAELAIISSIQHLVFKSEIDTLRRAKSLPRKHKLYKYQPFVDEKGIFRITTRLSKANSNFSEDKINPIILPGDHKLTELIVMQFHENNHHVHYNTVVNDLQQSYYIPNIRWKVKKIIRSNCYKCKKFNAKPDVPQMGDLPGLRLASYTPPFTYTIADVCGPFMVKIRRGQEKRWLLVFSCLTSRATHIEIIHHMTSESCLMALESLITHRGTPKRIITDRGSNFIGTSNILEEMKNKWNQKLLEDGIIFEAIEWEFSPGKASSMNGSVERIVGLIKNLLRKMHDTLNQNIILPDEETFKCMVVKIINLINNRPLSMIPLNEIENSYLTPNYFLTLRPNAHFSPTNVELNTNLLSNWNQVQRVVEKLWDHWQKTYLTDILHRNKWHNPKTPIEKGDIVVLADPSVYNLWRLGVVIKADIGSRNQTRKITIRLGKRNIINTNEYSNPKNLIGPYKKETATIVERPASQIARIGLKVSHLAEQN